MSGGKWRVGNIDQAEHTFEIYKGEDFIGEMKSAALAASVVAQHNATGEPVAWALRHRTEGILSTWSLKANAESAAEMSGCDVVPLYVAPGDTTAVVEGLRAKWAEIVLKLTDDQIPARWKRDAADEILASFKSAEASP